jgi:hypothetical protein
MMPVKRLRGAWPMQPCLLDPAFLFSKLGKASADNWLPEMFKLAAAAACSPWLVANLVDIEEFLTPAVLAIAPDGNAPLAIRVSIDELEDPNIENRLHRTLLSLVRKPSETLLVLDFGGPEYSDTNAVAEILVTKIEQLLAIGIWQHIIWHSTSFPEVNPGKKGELEIIPRGEWLAFNRALEIDPGLKNFLIFGDYAADSAKFLFGKGRAAIPHLRYSTIDQWLVSRGKEKGNHAIQMPSVASKILDSGSFYGEAFSKGDRYIVDLSKGLSVGGAKEWRKANICHHLTQVISAIGSKQDFVIEKIPTRLGYVQTSLFSAEETK